MSGSHLPDIELVFGSSGDGRIAVADDSSVAYVQVLPVRLECQQWGCHVLSRIDDATLHDHACRHHLFQLGQLGLLRHGKVILYLMSAHWIHAPSQVMPATSQFEFAGNGYPCQALFKLPQKPVINACGRSHLEHHSCGSNPLDRFL